VRTADLYGKPPGELVRQFDRRRFQACLDVRVIDKRAGRLDQTKWQSHHIPNKAIRALARDIRVDKVGTLTMSLDAEKVNQAMPRGVRVEQYFHIEVRWLQGGTWPYFSGVIDKVRDGWAREAGSTVRTLEVECFDRLQLCKGVHVNVLDPMLSFEQYAGPLLGLCTTQRIPLSTPVQAGQTEFIPSGSALAGSIGVFRDAACTDPYTPGGDYTVQTSGVYSDGRGKLYWYTTPQSPRYLQFAQIEGFVVPKVGGAERFVAPNNGFVVLPYIDDTPRSHLDLFPTTLTAATDNPDAVHAEVADQAAWSTFLRPAELREYATVTHSDGTETTFRIDPLSQQNGNPWLLKKPAISGGGTPQAGDAVRVSTTEFYPCWADWGDGGNGNYSQIIEFYQASYPRTAQNLFSAENFNVKYRRAMLKPMANQGFAYTTNYYFNDGNEIVYGKLMVMRLVDWNSPERLIWRYLVEYFQIFNGNDVATEKTGAFVKNFEIWNMDLSEFLAMVKRNILPPNAYLCCEPDGRISVRVFRQKLAADFDLPDAISISRDFKPEIITATLIKSEDDDERSKRDMAAVYFRKAEGFQSGTEGRIFGGADLALQADMNTPAKIHFKLPADTPPEAFPRIKEVRVSGRGLLSAHVITAAGNQIYQVPDFGRIPIGDGEKPTEYVMPGETLARARVLANQYSGTTACTLVLEFEATQVPPPGNPNSQPGVNSVSGGCNDVRIIEKTTGAHKAELTADPAKAPLPGAWYQPDPKEAISYRLVPEDLLSLVQPNYGVVMQYNASPTLPRIDIQAKKGLTAQDCRSYAERYQDEHLRVHQTYTIVAPFDPRRELGDTGRVLLGDGTPRILLLWGQSERMTTNAVITSMTMLDYAA